MNEELRNENKKLGFVNKTQKDKSNSNVVILFSFPQYTKSVIYLWKCALAQNVISVVLKRN